MNKKLSISVSKEICCCNSCTAKNYPGDGVGKRVDKIYKIVAGQMVIHLCPECLQELEGLIRYEVSEKLVCENCKKVNPDWRYANAFNSSKFCNICGCYCGTYFLTDQEIESLNERHEKWLRKHK